MARRRSTATIYDVAAEAGVSIATVSRVLHDSGPVATTTRQRVLLAADHLRWHPNDVARALAAGARFGVVGMVLPPPATGDWAHILAGFQAHAADHDRSVLVHTARTPDAARAQVAALALRVDGLVVMDHTVPADLLVTLDGTTTPVVTLVRTADGLPCVRTDATGAIDTLVGHLVAQGRRRIAFLGDPAATPGLAARWEALLARLRAAGIAPPDEPLRCGPLATDGHAAATALIERGAMPDALLCATDDAALGACAASRDRDLDVPRDIAVTGWGDTPAARFVVPPLTSVSEPLDEVGALAARRLLDRIAGDRAAATTVLPAHVELRASSGGG